MLIQKSDINNSIRIIFIKVIIKIGIIKIYTKNTHFVTTKCDIKLRNNAIYAKTIKNLRNRVNFKLVNNEKKLFKM